MTLRMALALLALLPMQAPPPQPRQPLQPLQDVPNGSIEGVVQIHETNEPAGGVRVILKTSDGQAGQAGQAPAATTTDAGGRFAFSGLPRGAYLLQFSRNGLVRQEYAQTAFPGNGAAIDLGPGQSIRGLVVRLTPTASVSGHIRDSNMRPLVNVPVQLLQQVDAPGASGQRTLQSVMDGHTDDRGEYRFFFVTPGRYYLSAGTPRPRHECNVIGNHGDPLEEVYTYRYYPGVRDSETATAMDLEPGAAPSGADFVLDRQRLYAIRGRVIDAATGAPPASTGFVGLAGFTCTPTSHDARGNFELPELAPGSYVVVARRSTGPAGADARVEVVDSDVEGIVLALPPEAFFRGRWTMDQTESNVPGLAIRLASASVKQVGNLPDEFTPEEARLNQDGTLRLNAGLPGEYRLSLEGAKDGLYLKEATFGGRDVLNRPLRFPGLDEDTLEIRLARSVASVDGVVTDERLKPVASVVVVLAPAGDGLDARVLRTTTTDRQGRFNFTNVIPGDYRVSARTALKPYAYADEELQRQMDLNGKLIQVTERSKESIELRVLAPPLPMGEQP